MDVPPLQFGGMRSDGRFATIREIEAEAAKRIDPKSWTYVASGAGVEQTAAGNIQEFRNWWLSPRYEASSSVPATETVVFGQASPAPFFTAPFGLDHILHPDGILEVARAHRNYRIPLMLSRATRASVETIAKVAVDVPLFFQVLPTGTVEDFVALGVRAREAGCAALVVTMDGTALGWRDRCREDRFAPDMSGAWGNYRGKDGAIDVEQLRRTEVDRRPQLLLHEIDEASKACGLPWIAKGVLSGPEAERMLMSGASSIYVSNHGGRALDGVPPTLAVLPEVSDAAHRMGSEHVFFDGGVHRANDALKAIALGASSVGIGRLVAAALGAGGEAVVSRLFELLQQELENGLALLGRRSITDVTREDIVRAAR